MLAGTAIVYPENLRESMDKLLELIKKLEKWLNMNKYTK